MKAIYKKPGEAPKIIDIENTFAALRNSVGEHIDVFHFAVDACVIYDTYRYSPYTATIGGVDFDGPILVVGNKGVETEEFTDVPQPEVTMELLWPKTRKKRPAPARAGR